jgi:hypothetical protein
MLKPPSVSGNLIAIRFTNRNSKFNVMWMVPVDWDKNDDTIKLGAYLTPADLNQFLVNVYGGLWCRL